MILSSVSGHGHASFSRPMNRRTMPLTYPLPVPAGQHPPFAVVTPTDHRAWVFITAALGVALTFMSLVIRGIIRFITHATIGYDDAALLLATMFAVLQSSFVFAAGSDGLGQSFFDVDNHHRETLQRLYYASNLFYILSLCASRASILILLRRMMAHDLHTRLTDILAAILGLWTLASLLALALQCHLSAPWNFFKSECTTGMFTRWVGIEITGAVLEACILALTFCSLVWGLQVNTRRKVRIVVAFGVRALIVVFIGLRLRNFHINIRAIERDPTLNIAEFVCWTQAEMNFSIIAATAPLLRVVLMSVPGKVGGTLRSLSHQSGSAKHGSGGSKQNRHSRQSKQRSTHGTDDKFELSLLGPSFLRDDDSNSQRLNSDTEPMPLVPDGGGITTSTVQHDVYANEDSHGSQDMIIQKDVSWQVSYDQQ